VRSWRLLDARSPAHQTTSIIEDSVANFTDKQGQYLAYISAYTLIHRRAPAEADMQQFFRVTPPSVHRMIIELETRGLITRTPGAARSIRLTLDPEEVPALREPESIRNPVADH
jgi:DNA-binding MarR family transcriptional regulator